MVFPKSGINFVLYDESFCVVEENTGYLPVDDRINSVQACNGSERIYRDIRQQRIVNTGLL